MDAVYISVEKNIEVFELFAKLWSKRGIYGIMVGSMTEAIEMAVTIEKSRTQSLYFIDIVADDINFMPLLATLDEVADAPILVATSNPNADERKEALDNGAHYYGEYCETPEQNIDTVIAAVKSYHRAKKQKTPSDILSCGEILISLSRHKVYVNDVGVDLTAQDFNVLHILMKNCGKVKTHGEIYRNIHNGKYDDDTAKQIVYNSIKRLRQKMRNAANQSYIQSVYDVGYKFSLETT